MVTILVRVRRAASFWLWLRLLQTPTQSTAAHTRPAQATPPHPALSFLTSGWMTRATFWLIASSCSASLPEPELISGSDIRAARLARAQARAPQVRTEVLSFRAAVR